MKHKDTTEDAKIPIKVAYNDASTNEWRVHEPMLKKTEKE